MRKRKGRRIKCLRERPQKKAASGNCFSIGTRFLHGLGYHKVKGVAHLRNSGPVINKLTRNLSPSSAFIKFKEKTAPSFTTVENSSNFPSFHKSPFPCLFLSFSLCRGPVSLFLLCSKLIDLFLSNLLLLFIPYIFVGFLSCFSTFSPSLSFLLLFLRHKD